MADFFAQLDAELIEGVDAPDEALRVDLVFVKRDQRAECGGRELLEHDD